MADDTARANPVSLQGLILRAEDDALARPMGRAEYSGRILGMGVGPLPVRPTSRSSASRLTTQMNEMMKKWEEERRKAEEEKRTTDEERRTTEEERRRADEKRRRTNERIAKQDQMMEKMQKMIDNLASANASLVANASSTLDIASPNFVRVRSIVASPLG